MRNPDDRQYFGPEGKFEIPERLRDFKSPYIMSSEEIQDLNQKRPLPFVKHTIALATARTEADPFVIEMPGRGFVAFGFVTSTEATYKTVASNVLINVRVNQNLPECEWPAKHNRGFRGDFEKLYLSWPAQVTGEDVAVSVDFIVFKYDGQPYSSGESAT